MKAVGHLALLFLMMSIMSCSSGTNAISNDGAGTVSAPATLAGKTYRVTVDSGSGVFASTGTFTVGFLSDQPIYTTQWDDVKFRDSWGVYVYSSSGDSGTVEIEDSSGVNAIYSFTFSAAASGTYVVTATTDENSRQSGTFSEQ